MRRRIGVGSIQVVALFLLGDEATGFRLPFQRRITSSSPSQTSRVSREDNGGRRSSTASASRTSFIVSQKKSATSRKTTTTQLRAGLGDFLGLVPSAFLAATSAGALNQQQQIQKDIGVKIEELNDLDGRLNNTQLVQKGSLAAAGVALAAQLALTTTAGQQSSTSLAGDELVTKYLSSQPKQDPVVLEQSDLQTMDDLLRKLEDPQNRVQPQEESSSSNNDPTTTTTEQQQQQPTMMVEPEPDMTLPQVTDDETATTMSSSSSSSAPEVETTTTTTPITDAVPDEWQAQGGVSPSEDASAAAAPMVMGEQISAVRHAEDGSIGGGGGGGGGDNAAAAAETTMMMQEQEMARPSDEQQQVQGGLSSTEFVPMDHEQTPEVQMQDGSTGGGGGGGSSSDAAMMMQEQNTAGPELQVESGLSDVAGVVAMEDEQNVAPTPQEMIVEEQNAATPQLQVEGGGGWSDDNVAAMVMDDKEDATTIPGLQQVEGGSSAADAVAAVVMDEQSAAAPAVAELQAQGGWGDNVDAAMVMTDGQDAAIPGLQVEDSSADAVGAAVVMDEQNSDFDGLQQVEGGGSSGGVAAMVADEQNAAPPPGLQMEGTNADAVAAVVMEEQNLAPHELQTEGGWGDDSVAAVVMMDEQNAAIPGLQVEGSNADAVAAAVVMDEQNAASTPELQVEGSSSDAAVSAMVMDEQDAAAARPELLQGEGVSNAEFASMVMDEQDAPIPGVQVEGTNADAVAAVVMDEQNTAPPKLQMEGGWGDDVAAVVMDEQDVARPELQVQGGSNVEIASMMMDEQNPAFPAGGASSDDVVALMDEPNVAVPGLQVEGPNAGAVASVVMDEQNSALADLQVEGGSSGVAEMVMDEQNTAPPELQMDGGPSGAAAAVVMDEQSAALPELHRDGGPSDDMMMMDERNAAFPDLQMEGGSSDDATAMVMMDEQDAAAIPGLQVEGVGDNVAAAMVSNEQAATALMSEPASTTTAVEAPQMETLPDSSMQQVDPALFSETLASNDDVQQETNGLESTPPELVQQQQVSQEVESAGMGSLSDSNQNSDPMAVLEDETLLASAEAPKEQSLLDRILHPFQQHPDQEVSSDNVQESNAVEDTPELAQQQQEAMMGSSLSSQGDDPVAAAFEESAPAADDEATPEKQSLFDRLFHPSKQPESAASSDDEDIQQQPSLLESTPMAEQQQFPQGVQTVAAMDSNQNDDPVAAFDESAPAVAEAAPQERSLLDRLFHPSKQTDPMASSDEYVVQQPSNLEGTPTELEQVETTAAVAAGSLSSQSDDVVAGFEESASTVAEATPQEQSPMDQWLDPPVQAVPEATSNDEFMEQQQQWEQSDLEVAPMVVQQQVPGEVETTTMMDSLSSSQNSDSVAVFDEAASTVAEATSQEQPLPDQFSAQQDQWVSNDEYIQQQTDLQDTPTELEQQIPEEADSMTTVGSLSSQSDDVVAVFEESASTVAEATPQGNSLMDQWLDPSMQAVQASGNDEFVQQPQQWEQSDLEGAPTVVQQQVPGGVETTTLTGSLASSQNNDPVAVFDETASAIAEPTPQEQQLPERFSAQQDQWVSNDEYIQQQSDLEGTPAGVEQQFPEEAETMMMGSLSSNLNEDPAAVFEESVPIVADATPQEQSLLDRLVHPQQQPDPEASSNDEFMQQPQQWEQSDQEGAPMAVQQQVPGEVETTTLMDSLGSSQSNDPVAVLDEVASTVAEATPQEQPLDQFPAQQDQLVSNNDYIQQQSDLQDTPAEMEQQAPVEAETMTMGSLNSIRNDDPVTVFEESAPIVADATPQEQSLLARLFHSQQQPEPEVYQQQSILENMPAIPQEVETTMGSLGSQNDPVAAIEESAPVAEATPKEPSLLDRLFHPSKQQEETIPENTPMAAEQQVPEGTETTMDFSSSPNDDPVAAFDESASTVAEAAPHEQSLLDRLFHPSKQADQEASIADNMQQQQQQSDLEGTPMMAEQQVSEGTETTNAGSLSSSPEDDPVAASDETAPTVAEAAPQEQSLLDRLFHPSKQADQEASIADNMQQQEQQQQQSDLEGTPMMADQQVSEGTETTNVGSLSSSPEDDPAAAFDASAPTVAEAAPQEQSLLDRLFHPSKKADQELSIGDNMQQEQQQQQSDLEGTPMMAEASEEAETTNMGSLVSSGPEDDPVSAFDESAPTVAEAAPQEQSLLDRLFRPSKQVDQELSIADNMQQEPQQQESDLEGTPMITEQRLSEEAETTNMGSLVTSSPEGDPVAAFDESAPTVTEAAPQEQSLLDRLFHPSKQADQELSIADNMQQQQSIPENPPMMAEQQVLEEVETVAAFEDSAPAEAATQEQSLPDRLFHPQQQPEPEASSDENEYQQQSILKNTPLVPEEVETTMSNQNEDPFVAMKDETPPVAAQEQMLLDALLEQPPNQPDQAVSNDDVAQQSDLGSTPIVVQQQVPEELEIESGLPVNGGSVTLLEESPLDAILKDSPQQPDQESSKNLESTSTVVQVPDMEEMEDSSSSVLQAIDSAALTESAPLVVVPEEELGSSSPESTSQVATEVPKMESSSGLPADDPALESPLASVPEEMASPLNPPGGESTQPPSLPEPEQPDQFAPPVPENMQQDQEEAFESPSPVQEPLEQVAEKSTSPSSPGEESLTPFQLKPLAFTNMDGVRGQLERFKTPSFPKNADEMRNQMENSIPPAFSSVDDIRSRMENFKPPSFPSVGEMRNKVEGFKLPSFGITDEVRNRMQSVSPPSVPNADEMRSRMSNFIPPSFPNTEDVRGQLERFKAPSFPKNPGEMLNQVENLKPPSLPIVDEIRGQVENFNPPSFLNFDEMWKKAESFKPPALLDVNEIRSRIEKLKQDIPTPDITKEKMDHIANNFKLPDGVALPELPESLASLNDYWKSRSKEEQLVASVATTGVILGSGYLATRKGDEENDTEQAQSEKKATEGSPSASMQQNKIPPQERVEDRVRWKAQRQQEEDQLEAQRMATAQECDDLIQRTEQRIQEMRDDAQRQANAATRNLEERKLQLETVEKDLAESMRRHDSDVAAFLQERAGSEKLQQSLEQVRRDLDREREKERQTRQQLQAEAKNLNSLLQKEQSGHAQQLQSLEDQLRGLQNQYRTKVGSLTERSVKAELGRQEASRDMIAVRQELATRNADVRDLRNEIFQLQQQLKKARDFAETQVADYMTRLESQATVLEERREECDRDSERLEKLEAELKIRSDKLSAREADMDKLALDLEKQWSQLVEARQEIAQISLR